MRQGRGHAAHHGRMPRGQRALVYLVVGLIWLSGCVWLYLDYFVAKRGPFGSTPHPLEPPILRLHGVVAVLCIYLFGWITARHVTRWWPRGLRRASGGSLAALLAVLSVSGFALFFLTDDASQHAVAVIHDIVGLALTVSAVQHWFFSKVAR
jgi:hypothetical protein